MNDPSYTFFLEALRNKLSESGRGGQKNLSIDINKSPAFISSIFNGKMKAGYDTQVLIAQAFGFTYFDFLKYGKNLLEKNEIPPVNETIQKRLSKKNFGRIVTILNRFPDEELDNIGRDIEKELENIELKKKLQETLIQFSELKNGTTG